MNDNKTELPVNPVRDTLNAAARQVTRLAQSTGELFRTVGVASLGVLSPSVSLAAENIVTLQCDERSGQPAIPFSERLSINRSDRQVHFLSSWGTHGDNGWFIDNHRYTKTLNPENVGGPPRCTWDIQQSVKFSADAVDFSEVGINSTRCGDSAAEQPGRKRFELDYSIDLNTRVLSEPTGNYKLQCRIAHAGGGLKIGGFKGVARLER